MQQIAYRKWFFHFYYFDREMNYLYKIKSAHFNLPYRSRRGERNNFSERRVKNLRNKIKIYARVFRLSGRSYNIMLLNDIYLQMNRFKQRAMDCTFRYIYQVNMFLILFPFLFCIALML